MRALSVSCFAAVIVAAFCNFSVAAEPEWIEMFNGQDLTGWKISDNGQWKVEEGCIVANGPRSHLFFEQDFQDFVFETEIKTTPGSNSGIYVHTDFQETGWPEKGHEIQVNVSQRDPVKSGSLYLRVKLFDTEAKDNEWYRCRITVKGNTVKTEINDRVLYEYVEPAGVTDPRRLSQGKIALQAHDPDSVVYYRNLRVRRLEGGK